MIAALGKPVCNVLDCMKCDMLLSYLLSHWCKCRILDHCSLHVSLLELLQKWKKEQREGISQIQMKGKEEVWYQHKAKARGHLTATPAQLDMKIIMSR